MCVVKDEGEGIEMGMYWVGDSVSLPRVLDFPMEIDYHSLFLKCSLF